MKMYRKVSILDLSIPEDPIEPDKKKVCTGCHLSLISDDFHKDPYRRDGFDIYCKKCRSKMKKIYGNRIKQDNLRRSNV